MKKLLFSFLLLISASVYADRLGNLRSGADVQLSTQTGVGVTVYPATAPVQVSTIAAVSDSTSGILFNKADLTTNIMSLDTINSRVGVGTVLPVSPFHVYGVGGVTIEGGGLDGNPGDELVFVTPGYPTMFYGKIQTSHSGDPTLCFMKFLVSDGSSYGSNTILTLTNGKAGIMTEAPTAKFHLPASEATAEKASMKITPGVLASAPASGNVESDGTHIYWTDSGATRWPLDTTAAGVPASIQVSSISAVADSTSGIMFNKADMTTNIMTLDTINSRLGIGTVLPATSLHVNGGALTVTTDGADGAFGDKIVFGLPTYPTAFNHRIKTTHSGDPALNSMIFSISSGTLHGENEILTLTNESIILSDGGNLAFGTVTGTKIGTATSQKLGFYNAVPVDQPATVADATGGLVVDTEARAAVNSLIDRLQELGLIQ